MEESPELANKLSELGWQVTSYHPHAMSNSHTHSVNSQIHAGQYLLVWLALPRGNQSVPPNKYATTLREIAAAAAGCTAIVSAMRGRTWQNPDIQNLLKDGIMSESRHFFRSYGAHTPGTQLLSSMCLHV